MPRERERSEGEEAVLARERKGAAKSGWPHGPIRAERMPRVGKKKEKRGRTGNRQQPSREDGRTGQRTEKRRERAEKKEEKKRENEKKRRKELETSIARR